MRSQAKTGERFFAGELSDGGAGVMFHCGMQIVCRRSVDNISRLLDEMLRPTASGFHRVLFKARHRLLGGDAADVSEVFCLFLTIEQGRSLFESFAYVEASATN